MAPQLATADSELDATGKHLSSGTGQLLETGDTTDEQLCKHSRCHLEARSPRQQLQLLHSNQYCTSIYSERVFLHNVNQGSMPAQQAAVLASYRIQCREVSLN